MCVTSKHCCLWKFWICLSTLKFSSSCVVTLWNIKTFQSCQMCIKPWHQHPVYCRAVTTTMLLHSSLGLLHTSCNTCLFVRSPWCSKSDDFYGFSLIFAEPGLEKEVGKIKTILLSLCFALQSSMSIFETVFILKLDSRYDCIPREAFDN